MSKYFFWLDFETTGIDENEGVLLEVAAAVTDLDFNILDSYSAVIFQQPEELAKMNDWCKATHGKSGLVQEVRDGIQQSLAEEMVVDLFSKYSGGEKVVLGGNTIDFDHKWAAVHMKKLSNLLHYRKMDVSAYKELFAKKYGISPPKRCAHRAMSDVLESIEEMKGYDLLIQRGLRHGI
jgi:oligoribonuclease